MAEKLEKMQREMADKERIVGELLANIAYRCEL